jgi:predicted Rossmann fold flavoprotein
MSGKIVIIGGGASGFFCAVNSARQNPELKVILLERSSKVLAKVRVSGGGRCNVTHSCFDNRELAKNYPRGAKELLGAFNRFSVRETINWFEQRGVKLKAEEDGRMFPVSNTSESIITCLMEEALKYGVEIKMNCDVIQVDYSHAAGAFLLSLMHGASITCDKLVIATGGRPKESGYLWLADSGHQIEKPVPSLFTFNIRDKALTSLMGLSVQEAKIRVKGHKLESGGPLLITHWGMSGPAILKLSAWGARLLNELNYTFTLQISWLTNYKEDELRVDFENKRTINAAKQLCNSQVQGIPRHLWEYLVNKAGISDGLRWADLTNKKMNVLIQLLVCDEYLVSGKTTFKEEFVTCGGIKLGEIDFKTMQSRKIKGLYFVGEVLDIDGVTGGFNFQNAWTTGWLAALDISKNLF